MDKALSKLLEYRSKLKEGYYMKIQVSYCGCLSFTIAEKKNQRKYSEKIWNTLKTLECRNPSEENLKSFMCKAESVIQKYL